MKSKLIRLVNRPAGMPQNDDFRLEEEELPTITDGQLLLKPLFISVDPYLRVAMSGGHLPALNVGDIIISRGIAVVVTSTHKDFKKNDLVMGYMEWRDILLRDPDELIVLEDKSMPLSSYLSVLGATGLSAYFALREIGKPQKGETVVVSGAAGAVGSIAGQIGKLFGCKVTGITGSDEKCDFIKNELGFDAAINYKANADISTFLDKLCPEGVDVYFDNVGGNISDAVISRMNDYGRIVACGTIADYNDEKGAVGPGLLPLVVYRKLLIQGFLIGDYKERFNEGRAQLKQWLNDGKLNYRETIVKGFEQLPAAFIGLFNGKNEGKMLVEM